VAHFADVVGAALDIQESAADGASPVGRVEERAPDLIGDVLALSLRHPRMVTTAAPRRWPPQKFVALLHQLLAIGEQS
jgi:hypothetical protein